MKAITLSKFGRENLVFGDIENPGSPGAGNVLIRYKAASLNYRDLLVIAGKYNPKFPLPLIPCSDGAGEIVEVGESVTDFQVGDRVMSCFAPSWIDGEASHSELRNTLGGPLPGTMREYAILPASGIVKTPDYLTDEEAACLPCAAVTSWSSLVRLGGIKAGDWVVVQGTGGVSLFAIQIAKASGAKVILTTGSEDKKKRGMDLGADYVIDYKAKPNWGREAKKITGDIGVDHVMEVGGAGTLEQSIRAIRPFGTIHLIGVLGGGEGSINLLPVVMNQVKMQGVVVGSRNTFREMVKAFEAHKIHPVVDQVFSWKNFQDALEHLKLANHFGKIAIKLD
ncbi:zinc-dependent alcohol dehydrogenase family protein [Leptospira sp. GIMC2001]|uniref:zinc-dependent alcohol dehydrogenase family protein n=1 Tax=Leptospira sp. GIMC2001 TaxID=1513297 RepID=UPI00234AAC8E|nr:NAD(P)-dependent alcohol dehydrogenase [Leptospira sp. GIMC2001]WCL47647.1 NAD(P)-dependent alcohol dehydrogenase [Leptospira sp. GIMC2001]